MVGKPTLRTYTFIKQIPVQGRFIDHNLTEPYKTCILSKINRREPMKTIIHTQTIFTQDSSLLLLLRSL